MTDSATLMPTKTLDDFIAFMHPGQGGWNWVLVERSPTLVRYESTIPAANGSCLLAGVLLIIGLIPGILYLVFARHPARTLRLTVTAEPSGALSPSGDRESLAVFETFYDPQAAKHRVTPRQRTITTVLVIAAVIMLGIAWLASRG